MSEQLWNRVAEKLDQHGYMTGVERTVERVRATGEVFTPVSLVLEMFQYLDLELFSPGRSVLDPACGDGQFLVAAKWVKVLFHGMTESEALTDIYGVDIMRDNVELSRRRLGGGTIVMGDTLKPGRVLVGQRADELEVMIDLFSDKATRTWKNERISRPKPRTKRSGIENVRAPELF